MRRLSATSCSNCPYVNRLADAECITDVDLGSWLEIASKRGSSGSVDAILAKKRERDALLCDRRRNEEGVRSRNDDVLLVHNIVKAGGLESHW